MKKEEINEIFRDHKDWLVSRGDQGKQAILYEADLYNEDFGGADLREANLKDADLHGTDLHGANLSISCLRGANLRGANLDNVNFNYADLRGADLRGTSFHGTNFKNASLRGAVLPKGIYAVSGAGSKQRYTYYDAVNDYVICGCWDDDNGNHLESFKKRVENVYGPDAKSSNSKHYKAYQAAIHYFEACRDAYYWSINPR